jgi:cobalt-zinc-cadmium efflux system outer membrane protein
MEELPEVPEVDSVLQYALDHRSDVQIARLKIRESERMLKLEKVRILKHLDLGVSYEREPEGSEVVGPGVEFQLPIFDQNRASVAKARYMLRKAEKELQALEGQIREDIINDLEKIKLYVSSARIYRDKTIPLNQKALEYAEQWVGMMQLNRLYLLEAQEKLLESQQDYLDMLMELRHSLLDLERHAGGGSP